MKITLKNFIGSILCLAVLMFAIVAFRHGSPVVSGKPVITIGATLPLTGNLAFLGESYRDAINLALKDLPSATKYTYRVVFEDDGFDPKKAASAAQKLIDSDKADILFSFGSPAGNAMSPIAEARHIPHLNGIASDTNVANGVYNFVHWTPPYEEARELTEELRRQGITRIGILETNQPGTIAVGNAVRSALAKTPIQVVSEERFTPGTKDFRSIISKVKNSGAEMYLLEATSPELEIVAKQMRELGVKEPFTSIEGFEFTDEPALFEGMWYVNAADPTADFVARFLKEYGHEPKLGAPNGYDAVSLIVFAVEHAKSKTKPTSEEIVGQLNRISNFPGAVGTLNVDADGLIQSHATVRMITNGKPVTIR